MSGRRAEAYVHGEFGNTYANRKLSKTRKKVGLSETDQYTVYPLTTGIYKI